MQAKLVKSAVVRAPIHSRRGLQERAFTLAFSGLVYPQIWEDPEVDIAAMEPLEGKRIAAIASGGCNLLAYLTERPEAIVAVDLNPAHVALNRLKLTALQHLPDHETFFRFFGAADQRDNIDAFDRWLAPRLDPRSRAYWNERTLRGRRIGIFARNAYRAGLLGRFLTVAHVVARLHGADPRRLMAARDRQEQERLFDAILAPVFDAPLVRWLCGRPAALYGLGIPPAQFDDLSAGPGGDMASVLRDRLRRLACDFDLAENYFAWQAFGRRYDTGDRRCLPRYLQADRFLGLRATADRVDIACISMTERLRGEPATSLDRYVLLDAQDWMDNAQLADLWSEIGRTARPEARVIFRTAGAETILPGRLPASLLDRWDYDALASEDGHRRDRSSIYGGFHVYRLKDE
ncbi:DUF3419 family protein [Marinivivus vitaminiproducens]|uniref:DUF3419 family protein n=1 Tax=Marinivivus vitaminiproducens TaxID=3035935 RepID=UPI0027A4D673|nr:DUF3419 family protein [Geminicoccaceae bacterium SCSIO 64248]